tara:strand:- start:324 stop:773 length:450 start_codon:yes stop_codon:yes gene_type:complete
MAKKKTTKKTRKSTPKPPSAPALDDLSFDELQREMQRREREMKRLVNKRDRLHQQIREVEDEIQSLGGAGAFGMTAGGRPRRRPQNESSLSEALLKLLKNTTMSVTQAADEVQRAGYQTTSASFRTIVNQTLIKDPRFKKVSRGQYTAK